MSGYDNLISETLRYPAVNFGGGTTTQKIPVPCGAKLCRVLDIAVIASIVFTQVTTPALVQVGDGTTPNKFAQLTVGGLAAGNSITGNDQTGGTWISNYLAANYNSGGGLHDLVATFVAPTGGSPTGTGDVLLRLGWDQIHT